MDVTCKRCGASVTGAVCEYCGVLTVPLENLTDEKQAVDEFHDILLTKDEKTQINMLKHGFLPTFGEVLVEAGVRCIPLVDINQPSNKTTRSAAGRLQAIVTKIKLMPDFPQKTQAITEFEVLLETHRLADNQLDKTMNRIFLGVGLLFLICSGVGIWQFIQ